MERRAQRWGYCDMRRCSQCLSSVARRCCLLVCGRACLSWVCVGLSVVVCEQYLSGLSGQIHHVCEIIKYESHGPKNQLCSEHAVIWGKTTFRFRSSLAAGLKSKTEPGLPEHPAAVGITKIFDASLMHLINAPHLKYLRGHQPSYR